MNFFTKVILGTVLVLVAVAGIVLLLRGREAARVEALLREAVGWAEKGYAERLVELIDENFEGDREWVVQNIRSRIRPRAFDKIEVLEISVSMAGDEAHARIVLRFTTSQFPVAQEDKFLVKLRKREAGWRVIRVRREDPTSVTT